MVDALEAAGHEVVVLTGRGGPRCAAGRVRRELHLVDLLFEPWPAHRATPATRALRHLEGRDVSSHNVGVLLDVISDVEPEVVYLWNLRGIGATGIVAALAQLQLAVTWHLMDAAPLELLDPLGTTAFAVTPSALAGALRATYVACSSRLVQEIEGQGFPLAPRRLVPGWLTDRPVPTRRYFPQHDGLLRIVSAGQLARHKGIHVILDAVRELIGRGYAEFHVDIYGKGERSQYEQVLHGLGIEHLVTLKGPIPQAELIDRYTEYDLFLFPTWQREPFGFAPLEAAAQGCVPVISADCGAAEWLVAGVDCLKRRPHASDFADLIATVLDGGLDLREFAERSSRSVRREFAITNFVPAVEAAFDEARALPSAPPAPPDRVLMVAELAERLAHDVFERTSKEI